MKKIFSIALFCVFLFNVGGYYAVYVALHYSSSAKLSHRLDSNSYTTDETITIKIPYNLPYHAEGKTFERIEGDFQHNGEFYKLVKQKVENDTLYVVCIKDNNEKKNFGFIADMVKVTNDLPASSSALKLLSSLIKDYVPSLSLIIVSQQGWTSSVTFTTEHFTLLMHTFPVFTPPPQAIVA